MNKEISNLSSFQIGTVAVLGLLTIFMTAEIAMRYNTDTYQRGVYMYDSDLVWTLVEDKSISAFGHEIRTNNHGFRDEPFERSKNENLTIAVLGDSYTAAIRVPEDERFTEILERNLEKEGISAEVHNFGGSAYATDQQLIAYKEKVRKTDPDLVILMVAPNDIRESYNKELYTLEAGSLKFDEGNKAFQIGRTDRLMWYLSTRSTLFFKAQSLLGKNYGTARRLFDKTTKGVFFNRNYGLGPAGILFRDNQTEEVRAANELWVKLIERLNNEVSRDQAEFAMFLLPIEKQFESFPQNKKIDADRLSGLFNKTAENHSIDSKDLFIAMNKSNNKSKYFLSDDYHYSPEGHQFIARYLTEFIMDRRDNRT